MCDLFENVFNFKFLFFFANYESSFLPLFFGEACLFFFESHIHLSLILAAVPFRCSVVKWVG